jgi:UDP-N-acetylglucosamine:LPS N-acetylglucosamine transferase
MGSELESKNIAIAGEITPSKTIIPIIEKLREYENDSKLNFKINKIIGLYHGESSKSFLEPYCDSVYSIGEGRRGKKNSKGKLAYLISKDILKSLNALKGKGIDLLITAGNAGDVRKAIVAANMLRIPVLHIEQDIYNPIESISQANLVTVPSEDYKEYLEKNYGLNNVVNIEGYPMAKYVDNHIKGGNLIDKDEIYGEYGMKEFVLVVFGGDLKDEDIEPMIRAIEELNLKALIAPYRFDRNMVQDLVLSPNIKVLPQYVDLLSFMNAASHLIYAAGMGMTIEAGVFNIPSLKIEGFHKTHGSVDLAKSLNIPIVKIEDIPKAFENLPEQKESDLVKNSEVAIEKVVDLINEFDAKDLSRSGFKSTKKIWDSRKVYR